MRRYYVQEPIKVQRTTTTTAVELLWDSVVQEMGIHVWNEGCTWVLDGVCLSTGVEHFGALYRLFVMTKCSSIYLSCDGLRVRLVLKMNEVSSISENNDSWLWCIARFALSMPGCDTPDRTCHDRPYMGSCMQTKGHWKLLRYSIRTLLYFAPIVQNGGYTVALSKGLSKRTKKYQSQLEPHMHESCTDIPGLFGNCSDTPLVQEALYQLRLSNNMHHAKKIFDFCLFWFRSMSPKKKRKII